CSAPHHVSIARGDESLRQAEIVHRVEDVGLAGAIRTVQEVHRGPELARTPLVGAKLGKSNRAENHLDDIVDGWTSGYADPILRFVRAVRARRTRSGSARNR